MDTLRSSFVLLILCLCIHVVETVNTSSTDIVQEKEVILGEVMESAALQFDNNDNYKTDDSKWQTPHLQYHLHGPEQRNEGYCSLHRWRTGSIPANMSITHSSKDATDDQESSTFLVSYLKYSIISV